jgi:putative copper export protein
VSRAARRALVPLLLVVGSVAVVAGVAALAGTSFERAVALGLYAVGSFMTIVGFALGSRNLFRSAQHSRSDDQDRLSRFSETNEAAALLIVLGIVLLLAGTAVDPHARLI